MMHSQLDAEYGARMLERTYRLSDVLCAFPSRTFYGDRLAAAPANAERRIAWDGEVHPALEPDPPAVEFAVKELRRRRASAQRRRKQTLRSQRCDR